MNSDASNEQPQRPLELNLPTEDELRDAAPEDEASLDALARRFVDTLLTVEEAGASDQRREVDELGLDVQRQAAHRSEMLKTPLRQLAGQGDDGGPVASALLGLREQMRDLDPNRQRLGGAGNRLLARIPGLGSRLQRYFRKFETAQAALDAILQDLEAGRDMLRRDNLTLDDDQRSLRDSLRELAHQAELGRCIDRRLQQAIAELPADSERRAFLEEELLFPLRQRIMDLQQQQAVCQQGILALEVIIRNNRELIRGVDRAINVTVSALNVAVTVALALANQRLVLDRIGALNQATSELIGGTARQLRGQGTDIQTRAADTMLDMKALESAWQDVLQAIDDVGRYRRDALPQLHAQIERMEDLSRKGAAAIHRLDRDDQT